MAEAPKSQTEKSLAALDKTRYADGGTPVAELRLKLQKEMQDHAAVYRTQESLAEGVVRLVVFVCVFFPRLDCRRHGAIENETLSRAFLEKAIWRCWRYSSARR